LTKRDIELGGGVVDVVERGCDCGGRVPGAMSAPLTSRGGFRQKNF